ncbi:hypothetical protein [Rhodopirellula sp. SWK7]|uniref:hypothetical protein n=1 Tax=Rhodopirellula sp. SWK7 TaxID=595460 RepID=UPI0011817E9C|nr:hypothetical protein [Rhodopirellula sp. SWK7]
MRYVKLIVSQSVITFANAWMQMNSMDRASRIAAFLQFLHDASRHVKQTRVSSDDPQVQLIRGAVEEHSVDDQGKPAMYQRFESALYDDAQSMVTLWSFFDRYEASELREYQQLIALEIAGLTGDRHPRKVFDRSPFGIVVLVVGTVTIWMTFLRTYTGDDLSDLLELIRFNWIAGSLWIVGLFVVIWYILKTHRNNVQIALLSSIGRALNVYLRDPV